MSPVLASGRRVASLDYSAVWESLSLKKSLGGEREGTRGQLEIKRDKQTFQAFRFSQLRPYRMLGQNRCEPTEADVARLL